MKKFFIFAIALVFGALTFTSCDKNKVDSPLVGTWEYITDPAPDSGWWGVYIFTFKADGTFNHIDEAHAPGSEEMHDGFIWTGPYEINGDIITIHKAKMGEIIDDKISYYDDYEPEDGVYDDVDYDADAREGFDFEKKIPALDRSVYRDDEYYTTMIQSDNLIFSRAQE